MIIHIKILIATREDDAHTTTILPLHTVFKFIYKIHSVLFP